jgi:hypothetical protein
VFEAEPPPLEAQPASTPTIRAKIASFFIALFLSAAKFADYRYRPNSSLKPIHLGRFTSLSTAFRKRLDHLDQQRERTPRPSSEAGEWQNALVASLSHLKG